MKLYKNEIKYNNNILLKNIAKLEKENINKIIYYIYNNFNFNINYIDINFLKNKEMLKINVDYLNHNFDTDVITFNLSNEKYNIIGDIYINIDMMIFNANLYNQSIENELVRLIIHANLHLIGKKDKTKKQNENMKILEEKYLNIYNKIIN